VHRRRTAIAAGVGSTALAGLIWLGIAVADQPAPDGGAAPAAAVPGDADLGLARIDDAIQHALARGRHVRIAGPRGPVHVWVPASYHADTGATIVYVHGYFDDADSAWTHHQLAAQFALSALNAVFIVPEAPSAPRTPVNYPDLGELLRLVEGEAGVVRGAALTAAVGHSGGHRTLQRWLDEPALDQLVMIDAMYGEEAPIIGWYEASPRRRLITVGQDTVLGTESLAGKLRDTFLVDRFPPTWETWPARARTARHVYVRAQYGHMPLVRDGIVLPSLLRLLPVELLADEPWQIPIGSLPPQPDTTIGDAGTD
jgi:hypothetical protein